MFFASCLNFSAIFVNDVLLLFFFFFGREWRERGSCSCVYTSMSFVFRGSRADLENGFTGFIPERRAVVCIFIVNLNCFDF